ncbi:hypothetical protein NK529_002417 [Citrobacter amalonaticus]
MIGTLRDQRMTSLSPVPTIASVNAKSPSER